MTDELTLLCNYSALRSYAYDNLKACDDWIVQVARDGNPPEVKELMDQMMVISVEFSHLLYMCDAKCNELKAKIENKDVKE